MLDLEMFLTVYSGQCVVIDEEHYEAAAIPIADLDCPWLDSSISGTAPGY